jgi:hypothetical protein
VVEESSGQEDSAAAAMAAAAGAAARAGKGTTAFIAAAQTWGCPTLRPDGTNTRGSGQLGCQGDDIMGTHAVPQSRGRRAHGRMVPHRALGREGPGARVWPAPFAPATRRQQTLASGPRSSGAGDAAPVGARVGVLERRCLTGSPVNAGLSTLYSKNLNCAKNLQK